MLKHQRKSHPGRTTTVKRRQHRRAIAVFLLPPLMKFRHEDAADRPDAQADGRVGREVFEGFDAEHGRYDARHAGCAVDQGFLSAGQVGVAGVFLGEDAGAKGGRRSNKSCRIWVFGFEGF